MEPFELVPELAECSCAVYPALDEGDSASVDDAAADTSSVGTKQSDSQLTRAPRPSGRRSFITRSTRRSLDESGAASPEIRPRPSESGENSARDGDAGTPDTSRVEKGPLPPLSAEERLEQFARSVSSAGAPLCPAWLLVPLTRSPSAKASSIEFADPYLQRFSSLHREQILHVWTNYVGQRVTASQARAAAEGVVQRGEEPGVPGALCPTPRRSTWGHTAAHCLCALRVRWRAEGVVQDVLEYRPSTTLPLVQRLCSDASLAHWREENGFPPLPSSWSPEAVRGARAGGAMEKRRGGGGQPSTWFRGASVPERMHCAVAQDMTVDPTTGLRRKASNLGEASKPRRSDASSEEDDSSEEEEVEEEGEGAVTSAHQEAEAADEVVLRATALDESLQPHVAAGHLTSASHTSRQLLLIGRLLLLWHQSREAPARDGSWSVLRVSPLHFSPGSVAQSPLLPRPQAGEGAERQEAMARGPLGVRPATAECL